MAQLTRRGLAELESLQQSLSEYRGHLKVLENNYIEKLSIAENTLQRIKSSVAELEILVSGIMKLYCTNNVRERARIEYVFQSILSEFESYDARVGMIGQITDRQRNSVFAESLAASTITERTVMSSMKNEAKQLIDEYKDAVARIKEQNSTIQSMIDERGKAILDSVKEHVDHAKKPVLEPEASLNKRNTGSNFYNKDDTIRTISPTSVRSPDSRFGKYAEINNFLDDLNRKKEENINRLLNIENRITVMRDSYNKDEELKASDLNKDLRKSMISSAERLNTLRRVDTNPTLDLATDSGVKRRAGILKKNYEYSNYRSELSRRDHNHSVHIMTSDRKKDSDIKTSFFVTGSTGSGKKPKSKGIKERQLVEGEVRQLDHEIEILSNLINSAMIQEKYQAQK